MSKRLAIYLASPMSDIAASPFPDYGLMFEGLLSPHLQGWNFHTFHIANGEFPIKPDSFDAVLITGSVSNVTEQEPWMQVLNGHIHRLDKSKTKLLAVCFGHQAVAKAFGGEVGFRDIVLGAPVVNIHKKRDWMQPYQESLRLYAGNFQQVLDLPEELTLLAGSEDCPIAMCEKGNHILTVQFHPEFDAGYMHYYTDKISDRISVDAAERGWVEISDGSDGEVFGEWCAAFLKS